ncbi:MAG: hypothetical protein PHW96_01240 [Candidatus Nanoarchaeia archaeon]|nr:hypothetical protein [Candidatus Nanoarchaeia archaeon]
MNINLFRGGLTATLSKYYGVSNEELNGMNDEEFKSYSNNFVSEFIKVGYKAYIEMLKTENLLEKIKALGEPENLFEKLFNMKSIAEEDLLNGSLEEKLNSRLNLEQDMATLDDDYAPKLILSIYKGSPRIHFINPKRNFTDSGYLLKVYIDFLKALEGEEVDLLNYNSEEKFNFFTIATVLVYEINSVLG